MDVITLTAERALAADSADHLAPWGTRRDNSVNYRFNQKLYRLFAQSADQGIRILDLGCAGGGFVRQCIDDGHVAVGLDGSDYSKSSGRAAWPLIPNALFVCDITRPFQLSSGGVALLFDVITSWEVLEHIGEGDLACVAANARKHLATGGLWIVSIAPTEDTRGPHCYHRTVRPKEWWIEHAKSLGWAHHERYVRYFNTQFIRGPKYGAPKSFHLALAPTGERAPALPVVKRRTWLYDRWLNSGVQRGLRKMLVGT